MLVKFLLDQQFLLVLFSEKVQFIMKLGIFSFPIPEVLLFESLDLLTVLVFYALQLLLETQHFNLVLVVLLLPLLIVASLQVVDSSLFELKLLCQAKDFSLEQAKLCEAALIILDEHVWVLSAQMPE